MAVGAANEATRDRWRYIRHALVQEHDSIEGAFDAVRGGLRQAASHMTADDFTHALTSVRGLGPLEAASLVDAVYDEHDLGSGVDFAAFRAILEATERDEGVQTDPERTDHLSSVLAQAHRRAVRQLTQSEAARRRAVENYESAARYYIRSTFATMIRLARAWASRYQFFAGSERAGRARVVTLEAEARNCICLAMMHAAECAWQVRQLQHLDREAAAAREEVASLEATAAQLKRPPPEHTATVDECLDQLRAVADGTAQ